MTPVKSKGSAKNDEYRTLERRKEVARMYLQGLCQWEIAHHFGVQQPVISKDLQIIRDAWLASAILDWDELKAKELAALDLQLEELWKAWYRSCDLEQVRTATVENERRVQTEGKGKDKKVVGNEMVPVKESRKVVEKQLIGDPRIMSEITKCRELRSKILGFLKPEEHKTEINTTVNVIDWEQVQNVKVEGDRIEDAIKALGPKSE